MDPALLELLRRGADDDEIDAVIRFAEGASEPPPGVRIVSRFNHIATCRLRRSDIARVHDHDLVASLKAPRLLAPEQTFDVATDAVPQPSDERRPRGVKPRGGGVLIGCLDWGIDLTRHAFRRPDGTTRLLGFWDQRPGGVRIDNEFGYGRIFSPSMINAALRTSDPYGALAYHPADADPHGHGAHGTIVMDIAAGNGRSESPMGVAPDADLAFVHLSSRGTTGLATLGDSVSIIEGIDFVRRIAAGRPVVLSLSLGRHGGPHDGTTLVELAIDEFLSEGFLFQSGGNYALKEIHASGELRPSEERRLSLIIDSPDPSVNEIEIWHDNDLCSILLASPDGLATNWLPVGQSEALGRDGNVLAHVYHRESDPQNRSHHADVFIYPGAPAGRWTIALRDNRSTGTPEPFHAWIERDDGCVHCQSRFDAGDADASCTLGTLASSRQALVCAAYDAHDPLRPAAAFSSWGPTRDGRAKPDLAAPGVAIVGLRSQPRDASEAFDPLVRRSGTSMATPYVAGCAALLLEATQGRLSHGELRDILVSTVDPASTPDRLGAGYLNIERALDAASTRSLRHAAAEHTAREVAASQEVEPMLAEDRDETPRTMVIVSGGPGLYESRDSDHDAAWSNYVDSVLLKSVSTDPKTRNNTIVRFWAADEEVHWLIFKPAYDARWDDDVANNREAAKRVKKDGHTSYVDRLEKRAAERGWTLHWLEKADDFWTTLGGFPRRSISRLWYYGHAKDNLWLSLDHDSAGAPKTPPRSHMIRVDTVSKHAKLRNRFEKAPADYDAKRTHQFFGCNTAKFAQAWSDTFGVWAEGFHGKVQFDAVHKSASREPSVIGACERRRYEAGTLASDAEDASVAADESGTDALFTSPDRFYRQLVSGGESGGMEIVGLPLQRLEQPLHAGDMLVRVALGEPGLGHVAVLSDGELLMREELPVRGANAEANFPGLYALVSEDRYHPHHSSNRLARLIADANGVLPACQIIVRPAPVPAVIDEIEETDDPSDEGGEVLTLFEEWKRVFDRHDFLGSKGIAEAKEYMRKAIEKMKNPAIDERELYQIFAVDAAENPEHGLWLFLATLAFAAARNPARLWRLLTTDVQASSSGWNIKTLPAPGTPRDPRNPQKGRHKYLIFSDLHRDSREDYRLPFKESIDHFRWNAKLYCRVLDHASAHGYTVLEAGDCEELWFIRDPKTYMNRNVHGETGATKKVREIIETYSKDVPPDASSNVYGRLRALHKQSRYFRLYGNHDSFLRPQHANPSGKTTTDAAAFELIQHEFQKDGGPTFQIYDAFVIDGVKTMLDHGWLDLVGDLIAGRKLATSELAKNVLKGRLGLNPADYVDTCSMLITHGHQFDFWNCDENQLLGLIISNTAATLLDRKMDTWIDLQGLAVQGNPFIQFDDVFASLPIFDSWPARQPAAKEAHRIQHIPSRARRLNDNIKYKESLAAVVGTFGLALNAPDGTTPEQSRSTLQMKTPSGIREYLKRHHSHHICIGHTHNPHSQPPMTLESIAELVPPLAPVVGAIRAALPIEPMLKTRYFNSGTGGWMEGIVWAIEIDESGQARLVFWTENSIGPEYMDWELHPLPAGIAPGLLKGLKDALPEWSREAVNDIHQFIKHLEAYLARFNVTVEELKTLLQESLMVPIDALGAALTQEAARLKQHIDRKLEDVGGADAGRSFFTDVVLTVKQRTLSGAASAKETFRITAPLPPAARPRLAELVGVYEGQQHTAQASLHYGALAFGVLDRFPRNWPSVGTPIQARAPDASRFDASSPALHALLATLWLFPPAGTPVSIGDDELTSRLELTDNGTRLRLTVALESRTPSPPASASPNVVGVV